MIKYIVIFCLSLFFINSSSQNLSLADLQNISEKTNWEYVNQHLISKGWEFYDSQKGRSANYNSIVWSFNKSYGDIAEAWFYLYTYEGFPGKIRYAAYNKQAYSKIQKSLNSIGYELKDSEINDNELISRYENANYYLEITTQKRKKDNNYSVNDESITVYNFQLVKKSGVYDPDNGDKIDYWDDGENVKMKYTLKGGLLNGKITTYHYNGIIKKTGSYTKGVADGKFIEYDKDGNKLEEYLMSNDERNGDCTAYLYNEGKLFLKITGNYIRGEKSGIWRTIILENGNERILQFENYQNGLKSGSFQEVKGDSLITGKYINDKLNGEFKVYLDITRMFAGGIISTVISHLTLISEGYYSNGLKSSYWKYYDLSGSLTSEGKYLNGKKSGEWRYYYTNLLDNEGNSCPYSRELYLVNNYSNGMLNGRSIRYSYLNKEEYLCSEEDNTKSSADTCTRMVYQKVLETSFYKNDELNGLFELKDSTGEIIAKGSFSSGLKQGEWLHRYSGSDFNGETYYTYQKGNYIDGKREGKWVQYYNANSIAKTFNYEHGELHGDYVEWNKFDNPSQKKKFEKGNFKELVIYDSLGAKPVSKYEIIDVQLTNYKCRKIDYFDNSYISQVYWIQKDGEIDHYGFELFFTLATCKFSDDNKGYEDGEYNHYINGKPIATGEKFKGDRVGWWDIYYYDENIKIEQNYLYGKVTDEIYKTIDGKYYTGDFTYIDNKQKLKEKRKIKNGFRHGKTVYYDLLIGKKIKSENYKNGILK